MRALDAGDSFVVTRNGVPVDEPAPVHRRRFVEYEAAISGFGAAAPLDPGRWRADLDRRLGSGGACLTRAGSGG
jgi:antitoxin (DNA-binding transcriptional repressor) of toxin-antitoxin stability system